MLKSFVILGLMTLSFSALSANKKAKNEKVWFEDRVELNQSAPMRKRFYNKKKYEKVIISGIEVLVEKKYYDPKAKPSL